VAEEPGASPAKPKKGESFLKKKVAGIPMPVILIVGGVAVYYLYSKYKANQTSSSSAATPTASSGTTPDTSGGYTGAGGYTGSAAPAQGAIDPLTGLPYQAGVGSLAPTANQSTPSPTTTGQSPTDTSQFTYAPPATVTGTSSVTPLGKKNIVIGGKSYATTANFSQNGANYYGISNPTEAKQLEKLGYSLIRNPNDPNGKGLFVYVPPGKTLANVRKPKAKAKAHA